MFHKLKYQRVLTGAVKQWLAGSPEPFTQANEHKINGISKPNKNAKKKPPKTNGEEKEKEQNNMDQENDEQEQVSNKRTKTEQKSEEKRDGENEEDPATTMILEEA
jgi:hypothetical protein